jgi:hypothetical protein
VTPVFLPIITVAEKPVASERTVEEITGEAKSEQTETQAIAAQEPSRVKIAKRQKLILRSRSKKERKRFTGTLKRNRDEAVKLTPTYKILSKQKGREKSMTFKTKNPRARAKIKKVMERWEPK